MGIVRFPVDRLVLAERMALSRGIAGARGVGRPALRVISVVRPLFCAACAAPIDFGAVWRGEDVFCSVECSLGGGRPA
jgi:hypothetical protein